MVSLFNRVRNSSSKNLQTSTSATLPGSSSSNRFDEFGQIGGSPSPQPFSTPQPKSKSQRARTISTPGPPKDLPSVPDSGFLPFHIPTKTGDPKVSPEYGYLSAESDVILSVEQANHLVLTVGNEIISQWLATPLLFSTQALDISSSRIKSLIQFYLNSPSPSAWSNELKLAGAHELAMTLRWGLARIVRYSDTQEFRGFIDWDMYVQWREEEHALRYPAAHFTAFLARIPPVTKSLAQNIFHLLSRLAAYSASSGLTPIALSSLFGPLIFGLGHHSIPFSHTYANYLKSSHATEHLLLSFIRNVEVETRSTAVEMPSRLKDWIRGYPIMISPLRDLEKPRRACKLIKLASIRRNVRLYSTDLVKGAASWATQGDIGERNEWKRVASKDAPPKYTDSFRKRLDLPHSYAPSMSSFHSSDFPSSSSLSAQGSLPSGRLNPPTAGLRSNSHPPSSHTLLTETESSGFRSLTDFKWGEFEALGFASPDSQKLQFDLTEGARNARVEKRNTMSWNDFSSAGFTRSETDRQFPLSATLQFSTPLSDSIARWPNHADDIHRKLKKTQKTLPAFGWDTTPVAGMEWLVEEGFADCWADLLLSSGWMDMEEGTYRDANWALVEFKAMPPKSSTSSPNLSNDLRTSSQWFLFEEFIPQEYRDSLANPPKKRGTLFSTTIGGKSKAWKPSTTLNGKPYNGRPRSPNTREAEFDAALRATTHGGESRTKIISLGSPSQHKATMSPRESALGLGLGISSTLSPARIGADAPLPQRGKSTVLDQTQLPNPPVPAKQPPRNSSPIAPVTPSKDKPRPLFRLPGSSQKRSLRASEYDPELDFETRTASDSSGEFDATKSKGLYSTPKHKRNQSKDDAWVDILVADRRRIAGQDASSPHRPTAVSGSIAFEGGYGLRTPKTSLTKSKSDPELTRDDASSPALRLLRNGNIAEGSSSHMHIREPSVEYQSDLGEDEEIMHVPPASSISPLPGVVTPAIHIRSSSQSSSFEEAASYQDPHTNTSDQILGHHRQSFEDDADDEDDVLLAPSESVSPIISETPQPLITAGTDMNQTGNISPDPADPTARKPQPSPRTVSGAVSSLIDLYGKKDAAAAASKIPIRTSPKPPKDALPDSTQLAQPLPGVSGNESPSPSLSRYVHGAPLHNVLEEESE